MTRRERRRRKRAVLLRGQKGAVGMQLMRGPLQTARQRVMML
jgi:hypothetical protein